MVAIGAGLVAKILAAWLVLSLVTGIAVGKWITLCRERGEELDRKAEREHWRQQAEARRRQHRHKR